MTLFSIKTKAFFSLEIDFSRIINFSAFSVEPSLINATVKVLFKYPLSVNLLKLNAEFFEVSQLVLIRCLDGVCH
jgi:hypothetical protein